MVEAIPTQVGSYGLVQECEDAIVDCQERDRESLHFESSHEGSTIDSLDLKSVVLLLMFRVRLQILENCPERVVRNVWVWGGEGVVIPAHYVHFHAGGSAQVINQYSDSVRFPLK